MTASALLQKARSFLNPQNLIILLAVSAFMPFVFTAIILCLSFFLILITPDYQRGIFNFRGAFLIPAFCAYAFCVAFLKRNLFGVVAAPVFFIIFIIFCFTRRFITSKTLDTCLNAVCLMVFPATATGIFEVFNNQYEGTLVYRCTSYFFNANYFGALMAAAAIICACKIIESKGKEFFYYPVALCAVISIYLSGSLFAIVEIIVGVTIYLLFSKHYRLFCLMVMIGSLILILIASVPEILPRLSEASSTTEYRIRIWGVAIREFKSHPIFGRDFLSYNEINRLYDGSYETQHCHNLFIDCMLNFGIIGTLILGAMFYFILKRILLCLKRDSSSKISIIIISIIAAVFAHCFTDITFFWIQTGLFYAIILGSIGCEERRLGIDNNLLIKGRYRI